MKGLLRGETFAGDDVIERDLRAGSERGWKG